MTPSELLGATFHSSEFDGDITLRGYFSELLATLWDEGEGFSAKRPFGNSGWDTRLEDDLARAGHFAIAVGSDPASEILAAIEALAIDNSSK